MFATQCSKPAATNAAMGKTTARILSDTLRPALASHTARQTSTLQSTPLKKASLKDNEHLAAARFTAALAIAESPNFQ